MGEDHSTELVYLNQPRPIRVLCDPAGDPRHVALRPGPTQRVVRVRDRWRIDEGWWRETPVSRQYYELEFQAGAVVVVYLDLLEDAWYRQPYMESSPEAPGYRQRLTKERERQERRRSS